MCPLQNKLLILVVGLGVGSELRSRVDPEKFRQVMQRQLSEAHEPSLAAKLGPLLKMCQFLPPLFKQLSWLGGASQSGGD